MNYNKNKYSDKKLYVFMILFVIIGALNWGLVGLINKDLVQELGKITHPTVSKIIYLLVGLSGLFLISKRDVYLPFLGDAVFPCAQLVERIPTNYTHEVPVNVPSNSIVVYWAAEPSNKKLKDDELSNPWKAYQNYSNSGVVKADKNGIAKLKIRQPQAYQVNNRKVLQPHIHYRYCKSAGMMSKIYTTNLD